MEKGYISLWEDDSSLLLHLLEQIERLEVKNSKNFNARRPSDSVEFVETLFPTSGIQRRSPRETAMDEILPIPCIALASALH